jgi:hypothetical protein
MVCAHGQPHRISPSSTEFPKHAFRTSLPRRTLMPRSLLPLSLIIYARISDIADAVLNRVEEASDGQDADWANESNEDEC